MDQISMKQVNDMAEKRNCTIDINWSGITNEMRVIVINNVTGKLIRKSIELEKFYLAKFDYFTELLNSMFDEVGAL